MSSEVEDSLVHLVPPLKMCIMIPEQEFCDSVFVWCALRDGSRVIRYREEALRSHMFIVCPAPTLQELYMRFQRVGIYLRLKNGSAENNHIDPSHMHEDALDVLLGSWGAKWRA